MAYNNIRQFVSALSRRLSGDRRGATAIVFAVGATALLGLVGLATEGGSWYLEKRHGQNAADAAATYGALALINGSSNPANDAQSWARSTYNYATGEANVTRGNYDAVSKTFSASSSGNALQAVVTRTPARLFSGLFLSTNPTISEAAVAVVSANGGNACLLAGAGGLNFAGSTLINASHCALASNKTGPNSIAFGGNKATVSNGTLVAEGGCSNCGNSSGYLTYQPPTSNPYSAIYDMNTGTGMTMPNFSGSHCLAIPTVGSSTTLVPWSAGAPNAYCGTNGNSAGSTLSTTNGNVLNFVPGTYFFKDMSLSFNGGTVNCVGCTPGGAGVTIILTGTNANKIGSISIGGNAAVNLNAPATNNWCHSAGSGCSPATAFDGVLFYMDKIANPTNGNGNAPVTLSGNGSVHLTGGMYFPTVNVTYSGDVSSSNSATACSEIIGYQFNITGNSTLNISGCSADGTRVAQTKSVQLVQ